MTVRREIAQLPSETGAWSRERPRHTCTSMSRAQAASPPASMPERRMLAGHSGEFGIAAEAFMNNGGSGPSFIDQT